MRYLSVLLVWISVMGWTTTVMAQQKEFYIATVHLDGKTSPKGMPPIPRKPFHPVLAVGWWGRDAPARCRGHLADPGFCVSSQRSLPCIRGDQVILHFLGVQGPHTPSQWKGRRTSLSCGAVRDIVLPLSRTKSARSVILLDRQPTMQGQVVVLPRP